MLSSTLLSVLATATTASAAKSYLAYAWNETAPEIHGMALQGRNGYFYLGGQSYPDCGNHPCSPGTLNKTIITGPLTSKYSNNTDGFFMSITDSQPQEIVTIGSTAELLYTLPRTDLGDLPSRDRYGPGTINTPFSIDEDDFSGQTVLRFNGNDFVSCPNYEASLGFQPYSVRALSYGVGAYDEGVYYVQGIRCYPFKLRVVEVDLAAPLYYKYPCHARNILISPPDFTCLDTMPPNCLYDGVTYADCTEEEKLTWAVQTTTMASNAPFEGLFEAGDSCQCQTVGDPTGKTRPPGQGVWTS